MDLARGQEFHGVKDISLSEEEYQVFLKEITEQELKDIDEAFAILDTNGDRKIDKTELQQFMKSLGHNPTPKEIKAMLADADKDGNKDFITYDEYLRIAAKYKKAAASEVDEEMLEAFKVFDKDGNGFIDARELETVLCSIGNKMTPEEVREMISEGDVDNNGMLDYQEFVKVMNKRM